MRSVPMVYASGTRTGGMMGATGGGQIGAALTTSSNVLSQVIAPPPKQDPYLRTAFEVMGWFISICFGILLLPLALGIPLIVQGRKARKAARLYNENEWPALYDRWSKGWLCMTCGVGWLPDAPLASAEVGKHSSEFTSTPQTVTAVTTTRRRTVTLHEAIEEILLDAGHPMTTTEIATEVNARGSYSKRDGSLVAPFQIHGRTRNYPTLFSRSGSTVSLVKWGDSPPVTSTQAPLAASSPAVPQTPTASVSEVAELEKALLNPDAFRLAGTIDNDVPRGPGLYAIRVREPSALPEHFARLSLQRGHDLLYVGIARESLSTRFLGQELRARGHGTFFRSIGAILGYRPMAGSLIGKGNTRNLQVRPLRRARHHRLAQRKPPSELGRLLWRP